MSKNYAIVDNGIVVNVIVADDNFIAQFHPDSAHPYEEVHADDTMVARIGDTYDAATGAFITPTPEVIPITSITKIQAMRQLKSMNLWTQFQTILSSNSDANDEWTLALSLEFSDPFTAQIGSALGVTDMQTLFNEASLL